MGGLKLEKGAPSLFLFWLSTQPVRIPVSRSVCGLLQALRNPSNIEVLAPCPFP
jgi:hypothetical protein